MDGLARPAADKAEALQSAEKADPRVDLEWMRIRYERDLNYGRISHSPFAVPRFSRNNATPKERDSTRGKNKVRC